MRSSTVNAIVASREGRDRIGHVLLAGVLIAVERTQRTRPRPTPRASWPRDRCDPVDMFPSFRPPTSVASGMALPSYLPMGALSPDWPLARVTMLMIWVAVRRRSARPRRSACRWRRSDRARPGRSPGSARSSHAVGERDRGRVLGETRPRESAWAKSTMSPVAISVQASLPLAP